MNEGASRGYVVALVAALGCSSGGAGSSDGGAGSSDASVVLDGGSDGGDAADGPPVEAAQSAVKCTTTLACVGGAVCCTNGMSGASLTAACVDPPCPSGVQLCLSSTECPSGMVCGRSPGGDDPTMCVAPSDASAAGAMSDTGAE